MSERYDPPPRRRRRAEGAGRPAPRAEYGSGESTPRAAPRRVLADDPVHEGHSGDLFADEEPQPARHDAGRRTHSRRSRVDDDHFDDDDDGFAGLFGGGPREIKSRLTDRGKGGGGVKRLGAWAVALGIVLVLALVSWYGVKKLMGPQYDDYTGSGSDPVVVQVAEGDTTSDVAKTLTKDHVVASPMAFIDAADQNEKIRGLQPGFYKVKKEMSGSSAVEAITASDAKLAATEIRGGQQLHDVTGPDGKKVPGIYTLLAQGSCDDNKKCVTAGQLEKAAGDLDLAKLGVPQWAVQKASQAPDKTRRLEGLIVPGLYSVKPGASPQEILTTVLTDSAKKFQAWGIGENAKATGYSPYEVLVVASVVEREGIEKDFGKVARVVYNRLKSGQGLQMDSTVNYELDRPTVRTTGEDRASNSPYNTYQNSGLPPTPISSPSQQAVEAALHAPPGNQQYFVKCAKDGTSCFASTLAEHQKNVAKAQQAGVY